MARFGARTRPNRRRFVRDRHRARAVLGGVAASRHDQRDRLADHPRPRLREHRRRGGRSAAARDPRFAASFPYGVHCAAVEVDVETGGVEVERYAIAYDVGRAVNPMLIEGQIVGGAAQGIGGALLEEFAYGPDGQLVAGSFMDYLLPTATELPKLRVLVTEDAPSPLSPFGAKGAGEGGTAAAGAAVANAVSDALGADALELPLTPERVVRLAHEREPSERR